MIPVIYALLFLITTIYAIVLDRARRRKWEPDWTWLEVAIGSSLCLAAATAATYAALGTAGLVIAGMFWLAFAVGGAPIIFWQIRRTNGRYRDAAAEARRLLQREGAMSTPRLRWPNHAEASRLTAKEIAEDAEALIQEAIADITENPLRCELRLVYVQKQLAHIQRILTEAKTGR